jgi:enoyl-CoA hydratase
MSDIGGETSVKLNVEWRHAVKILTIERPERRNAVDLETLRLIRAEQLSVIEEGGRALVITGANPAFCAGADLSGVREDEFSAALQEVLVGFTQLPITTIAAIDGPALGAGAQIAAACDIRVATAASVIGVPAAKLGLVVNHWTIERLVREFSWPVARAMLLTAKLYTGEQLAHIGSVHQVGDLWAALEWAHEISLLAPLTLAGHKLALETSAGDTEVNELVDSARSLAWASNDAAEGRLAFLEKRQPNFQGS